MMKNQENDTRKDLEWEQRKLCSDESCIGVIGPDGRCKECGRPYEGPVDAAEEESVPSDFEEAELEDEITEEPEEIEELDTETPVDLEWEQRTLCRDESCIGVIGPEGRCKECGKPYDRETENSEQEIGNRKEEMGNGKEDSETENSEE